MRRRTLIAGFLTLLVITFTNSFWLSRKPVDLQFELSGVDSVVVSYQLKNKIFSSDKVSKTFDLKKSNRIKLSSGGILKFNKVKTLVDTGFMGGNLLKLSIPVLRGGKYKLNNIDKFQVTNAEIYQKDNEIFINPKSSTF